MNRVAPRHLFVSGQSDLQVGRDGAAVRAIPFVSPPAAG